MKYNPRGSRCRTAASLRVSVYLSEAASLTRCRARKTGQLKQMISEKRRSQPLQKGDTFIAVGCTKTNISLIYAVFFFNLTNKCKWRSKKCQETRRKRVICSNTLLGLMILHFVSEGGTNIARAHVYFKHPAGKHTLAAALQTVRWWRRLMGQRLWE